MPYPNQNLDRVPWSILRASIRPHIARDLVFGSMDRQNALESILSHDLNLTLIDTLPNASKRLAGQFSPIPGLFQSIHDPAFCCIGRYPALAPYTLYFGPAPIRSDDLAPTPRRSRPKSTPAKPLKKCSVAKSNTEQNFTEKMFSRKKLPTFFENGFSAGSIFGSRT